MDNSIMMPIFIFLAAGVIIVPIVQKLGLGSVLGYLIAGIVIGPYSLGFLSDDKGQIMHFAEFGVVVMLFLVGLELAPKHLWRLRKSILALGGTQVFVTSGVMALIALSFGLTVKQSIAVGLILSLSSTAIALQIFDEKGWRSRPGGQAGFSVLLFQDIAVIFMIMVLPLLSTSSPTVTQNLHHGLTGWLKLLVSLGIVAGLVLSGRYMTRHIFRFVALTHIRELFTALALIIVIGIAIIMETIGLSAALGTFIAGVVLANSEYRHELESDLAPFKGLLLGVFFMSIGASINFDLIAQKPLLIIGLVILIIVVKLIVLGCLGRLFGLKKRQNSIFSVTLAQGGTFAFVLIPMSITNHVLPNTITEPLIAIVALSMAITPILVTALQRLYLNKLKTPENEKSADIIEQQHPVIVAGFGRFGQIVTRALTLKGFSVTTLDYDSERVDISRRFGNTVFYGDATQLNLLLSAGIAYAKIFVIAINNKEKATELTQLIRKHYPNVTIFVRAFDRLHALDLINSGAHHIFRETFSSSLDMSEKAITHLGVSKKHTKDFIEKLRNYDEESLLKMSKTWRGNRDDVTTPDYISKAKQASETFKELIRQDTQRLQQEHVVKGAKTVNDAKTSKETSTIENTKTGHPENKSS